MIFTTEIVTKNLKDMKYEKSVQKTAGKKAKTSARAVSTQPPPTAEEIKKALAAKKALSAKNPSPADIAIIQSLQLEEEVDNYEPIVFSDTWYEFSVLCRKLHISAATVGNWLKNGFLAYSEIGRFRFINKFDFEDMMMRFRKPASGWRD